MRRRPDEPEPLPATTPVIGSVMGRRGPMILTGEEPGPRRLWGYLFVTRHIVIVCLAVITGVLPEFGDDRWLFSLGLLLVVLPYDVGVHLYTRRHHRLPISMPFVYAPVPALFAIPFPEAFIPALVVSLGNLVLFTITFDLRVALASTVISVASLAVAVPIADPVMGRAGAAVFAITVPAVVLGVGALLETVRASEERYRDYVEKASDMIYVHDLAGTFLSANEAALQVTGYSREEFGRVTLREVLAPEYVEQSFQRLAGALQSAESLSENAPWELEILTKDGRRIPVEVTTRLVVHRGHPIAMQGIARDISDRRQVEAGRLALDRARSEFIANAAHELRTPLTTLSGLASVLAANRHETTDEELTEALESLARQGRRVQNLADRLLDLSTMDLGGMDVSREPIEVADLLAHALEGTPPPHDTSVTLSVDDDVQAFSDAIRLEEILANLLANAYRYGGHHVTVKASTENGTVEVTVEDDGAGVPAELVPRLFEPFTRGDNRGGTGLGLAICSRLAEALGGEIIYEPREPHGSRFAVRLPAAA